MCKVCECANYQNAKQRQAVSNGFCKKGKTMNRYNTEQRLVTPAATPTAYQITPSQAKRLENMAQTDNTILVPDQAFNPQATTKESTSPMERSKALIVRLLPVTLIYLVLSVALALAFNVALVWAFVGFAALTWWSYYSLDASERYDSATGVEHHRIEAAKEVALQKLANDRAQQQEITQAYIKMLGGDK